jgi:hypothetical protein
MKKIYFLLIQLLVFQAVFSQNYGNEWINYGQPYYAFPVVQNGLYRIDFSTLVASNISTAGIDPARFQLFGKDHEVPLYLVDGNDNSFDSGDYFLFYAEKNNGWADSLIYTDPSTMANPGYSLINDTVYYFFSWSTSANGLRFIPQTNQDYSSFTPENFVFVNYESAYNQGYYEGELYRQASGSIYAKGEGFGYTELVTDNGNVYYDIPIPTPNVYSGIDAPNSTIHFRISSNSSMHVPNLPDHHVRTSIGTSNYPLVDTSYIDYKQTKRTKLFASSLLSNGTTYFRHEIIWDLGPNVLVDRQALTYLTLEYPRMPISNGSSDQFKVMNNSNPFTRIDLANFTGTQALVLSFGSQAYAQIATPTAGVHRMLIPQNTTGNSTKVLVFDAANPIVINSLAAVNGTGYFMNYSGVSYDSVLIFITHPSLASGSTDYKNYRESPAGGSYTVVEGNINDLYFQFGGGIKGHPLSMRRFVKYIYDNSPVNKPVGMFILGKGLDFSHTRNNPNEFTQSLIPPLGYPASDNAITSGMNGSLWDPLVPTGRISVKSSIELTNYLQKVMTYEDLQTTNLLDFQSTKDAQKQILHFAGGSNSSQQTTFQNYLNQMKYIAEDTMLAANVSSYFKTSSNPLDPNVVTSVTEKIENGVSLMTFLSHAAASNNGFEINIDDPSNWNNMEHYPMVIGMSCYNGNIFSTNTSTSEKFVNTINEGSINFLSTISVGYDGPLAIYTTELYRQFSYKNRGKTFAQQIKHTIQNLEPLYSTFSGGYSIYYSATCSQMTLNGDPMLKMNFSTAPEIDIKSTDLSLSPTNINLSTDSVKLQFTLRNLGTAITSPVNIEIRRDFPGTSIDSIYTFSIPRLYYDTTISRSFPLQASISGGINTFTINIDLPSLYAEQFDDYANNTTSANFFLNIDGMLPIWPYNYAVVPYDTVTVKASTINPIATTRTYLFELDTTDTYNSPQLRKFSVTELGGVKQVKFDQWLSPTGSAFPLICTDSTVYFWRVAVDSTTPQWAEFSFQYIPGKQGWGQDHFFQFKNNSFSGLVYDRVDRDREFNTNDWHSIGVQALKSIEPYTDSYYNNWTIDGLEMDYATCGFNPLIYVGVVDYITLEAWSTYCPGCPNLSNMDPAMNFGNTNNQGSGCRGRSERYFTFDQTDPTSMANFQNMIENGIPDSNYVIIYSPITTYFDLWSVNNPSVFTMFQNLGFPSINSSLTNDPFAVIFQKGTSADNVIKLWSDALVTNNTPSGVAKIQATLSVLKPSYVGVEKTPVIGPAFEWQTVYWRRDSLESPATDSVRIFIEKYDASNNYVGKLDTVFTPNDSILNLNALIDAQLIPRIRIGIYSYDKINLTPAQIDRLHVLYSPVPEAAIDGTNGYYTSTASDTLYQGQPFSFSVNVVNVSDYDMDSLLIDYWLEDNNHIRHVIPYPRQDSLLSKAVLRDTITFNNIGTPGHTLLWMEVNPYVNGSTVITDQLEQYHYNNLLQLPIFVVKDEENPILDVTFNGRHILNNDIVDPNSEILITLKDDNPYLIMNDVSDTTLFGIYLTGPDGTQQRIPFIDGQGNTIMQWVPANNQDMKFKILYPKLFTQNGNYQLYVQGTDRSGNISGDYEYKVNFEVIRESTITQMMNYPNPFSTSTRFVFTLTGTQEPDEIIIRIMTVSGRVVREITEDDLGKIVIGRNITEYAWDGTDEFGDPLANGVYLYEVRAQINGQDIEHRDSGADQYFKKNFGKMYLMR